MENNNFCTHCGAKIEEDAKFCINCGSSLETPIEMPEVKTGSWGWVLGIFFGAFAILSLISMII